MPHPRRLASSPALLLVAAVFSSAGPRDAAGIEMFTFFGDGSRIGLPSLEVPIEAYPGIPLRSDRLRARRRAQAAGPDAAVRVGPSGYDRGVSIRAMPSADAPVTVRPAPAPRRLPRSGGIPIAPEPEDILPRVPLPTPER
jgi:hypothetical protein